MEKGGQELEKEDKEEKELDFLFSFSPFLTPEIARVSRPAGDLVGPGRWAPTTRAEDTRTLAYLVDAPEGR